MPWLFLLRVDLLTKSEGRYIASFWILDLNGRLGRSSFIKLAKFRPKAAGFDANDWIDSRVVSGRTAINFNTEPVFF